MHADLGTVLVFLLWLWLTGALLTLAIHVGASLAIDRRIALGLWEQWALLLCVALGPLGACLELLLVWTVVLDIYRQPTTGENRHRAATGIASSLRKGPTELR